MYNDILHALKGVPKDQAINFIIDRKAVIDVFNKFPTTYRERQETLHLDTLIQIEAILKERTAAIRFKHCYSHTKDIDNIEQDEIINKDKKIAKLIDQYGEEDAYRYIEGNHQADILADQSYSLQETKIPLVTKYHNKYISIESFYSQHDA